MLPACKSDSGVETSSEVLRRMVLPKRKQHLGKDYRTGCQTQDGEAGVL